jgi:hypothetical protein
MRPEGRDRTLCRQLAVKSSDRAVLTVPALRISALGGVGHFANAPRFLKASGI